MGDEIQQAMERWVERGDPVGGIALADRIAARLDAETPAPSWNRVERERGDPVYVITLSAPEPDPPRRRRSGWVLAMAAGVAVLAVGIPLLLLSGGDGDRIEAPVAPAELAGRPIDEIHDLTLAPDGTLWAATARGVVRWEPGGRNPAVYLEEHGLPAPDVGHVTAAPDGTVWAAGSGWLARFDGNWTSFLDWPAEPGADVGGIAVDPSGVLWAAVGEGTLLRFDGTGWEVHPVPLDQSGHPWTRSVAIATDGAVWTTFQIWDEGPLRGGLARYDGDSWTRYTDEDGLPAGIPLAIAAAPNGDIWAGFGAGPDQAPPAGGVARFDGTEWMTITAADGLALDETVGIAVAADGTVWATHSGGEFSLAGGGLLSSFDGTSWVVHAPDVGAPIWGIDPNLSGGVWLATAQGVIHYDGTATTTITTPEDLVAETAPTFGLEPSGDEPIPASTSIGAMVAAEYSPPTGRYLLRLVATSHGFAAVESGNLRWSADGVSWAGLRVPFEVWGAAPVGDDLIAFGRGRAAYLIWADGGWVVDAEVGLPPGPGMIDRVVSGPGGVVMTAGTATLHSADGRSFTIVSGPDPALAEAGTGADPEGLVGSCSPMSWGSGGLRRIGPVLTTGSGFVAITARWAADWNDEPICEPRLWSSPDGRVWDLLPEEAPFGRNAYLHDVAGHGDHFVAIGGIGSGAALWSSSDGLEWTRLGWDGSTLDAIAAGDLGWFLLGTLDPADPGFDEDHGYLWWYSADGLTWEGPFPRPEGLATGWSAPDLAVADDLAVGASYGVVVFRFED